MPALAASTWKTYDISSSLLEASKGVAYQDASGKATDLATMMKSAGANSMKIRVYVAPDLGVFDKVKI